MDDLESVELAKREQWNRLLNVYGELLTPIQKATMEAYYEYDLSLSEIAENHGTSRTAVLDLIAKGKKKLSKLEETLHILEKEEQIQKAFQDYLKEPSEENLHRLERSIYHGI